MTSWIKHPNAKALVTEADGAYVERFWARVLKTDGCWEWQGSRSPRGYGQCNIRVRDKVAKGRARNPLVEAARASTACKYGHRWTEETTYRFVKDGLLMRECRVCRYETNRRYLMRKRATL